MFNKSASYDYRYLGAKSNYYKDEKCQHLFRIDVPLINPVQTSKKKIEKEIYFVVVNHFKHDLMVVKFYPKKLQKDKNKFNLVLNNVRFSRLLGTVLKIAIHLNKIHPNSSFAFQGAPKLLKNGLMEQKDNTQKYRVYYHAAMNLMGIKNFYHADSQVLSIFCLVNKTNNNPSEYLIKCRDMLCDNSIEFRNEFSRISF